MLVAQYPYPTTTSTGHYGYYRGLYAQALDPHSGTGPPDPSSFSGPRNSAANPNPSLSGPRNVAPTVQPSFTGPRSGGPNAELSFMEPRNGGPSVDPPGPRGVPQVAGVCRAASHLAGGPMMLLGPQLLGQIPRGSDSDGGGQGGNSVAYPGGAAVTSGQCSVAPGSVAPGSYAAPMAYTQPNMAPSTHYMAHRRHSFMSQQFPPYGPPPPQAQAGPGFENRLCGPSLQAEIYPKGASSALPYPGYPISHKFEGDVKYPNYPQPCTRGGLTHPGADPGEPPVTPKVEPDSTWCHVSNPRCVDEEVLAHLQHVSLGADGASPPPPPPAAREGGRPRRKRRTSEKRKENSRVAARCRRDKESKLFDELAGELPLSPQAISQLDKASVMRLTLAYLRTRALCQAGFSKTVDTRGSTKLDLETNGLILKALDGFLLVLTTDGDIVHTSENIVAFLGLQHVDVMGQSVFEYTHPCDHDEVRELMAVRSSSEPRHAFLRFKCTLTAKGRSVNLKSATYKVVQVSGELLGKKEEQTWLVALATPVPHPSNIEFPLDKQTFVSRHSLDMKFTYVDDNVGDFCGYVADELVGRSLYEMHHALDTELVKDAYKTLRSKGQVETGRYRFLARGGGYVWLVTQATLIHGPKDHKPQYVVCLNYVLSGVESSGEILSELQLLCNTNDSKINNNNNNNSSSNNNNKSIKKVCPVAAPPVVRDLATPSLPPTLTKPNTQTKVCDVGVVPGPRVPPARPPPVATTSTIFAPRTEDMNKGYLIFSEDDPQRTVLKEEPEDLTHLAPSGGDTCVPLLEVAPLSLGLNEDSCLPQEVTTLSPHLDDMFSIDYQMHVENHDVLIPSPVPDKAEERDTSPKYLYDESHLAEGVKCMNSLSGGQLVLRQRECQSPLDRSLHPSGLGTPEPPKPLLTEAALPLPRKKHHTVVFGGSRPRTTTESFFTHLDESHTHGSTPGLFGKLDLKPEEHTMDSDEFEMRAPYIPLSNEYLTFDPDDLFLGAEPEPMSLHKHTASTNRSLFIRDGRCCSGVSEKEDSSLAQLLRDTDPPMTGGHSRSLHPNTSPATQRNQYYQNKFLDGGGNFVDPNKVLPGHYAGKDVEGGGGRSHLMDPPPVLVQETVDPPPPLLPLDTQQASVSVKRGHSPLSSPTLTHKKLCSPSCPDSSAQPSGDSGGESGGVRLLTTPYAPTMQQLLVSKEPITVRGGRPVGGAAASRIAMSEKTHSVLRNLLPVSGDVCVGSSDDGGGLAPPPCVPIARDKMAAMLLRSDDSDRRQGPSRPHPKLRLVAGPGTIVPAGHLAFKLSSSSSSSSNSSGDGGGEGRKGPRQDPLLLMNTDTTIPNLLDLTQQDYEVNAPANNCSLLQGADLLMALDQSL